VISPVRVLPAVALIMAPQFLGWSVDARAQTRESPGARANPSPAMVEQKASLVARLLNDAPASDRMANSSGGEAKAATAEAAALYQRARTALGAGDTGQADALLGEALALLSKSRQAGPRDQQQLARYQQLLESVQSLFAAYERRASSLPRSGKERIDSPGNQATAAMTRAATQADQRRYGEAIALLDDAAAKLLHALNGTLDGAELEVAHRFATPAEEYQFELARNSDYAALIPIALRELAPTGSMREEVAVQVAGSRQQLESAQGHAKRQDYPSALASIRQSTALLQRALGAAGLVMPRDPAGGDR
jgi:hypothetical protein